MSIDKATADEVLEAASRATFRLEDLDLTDRHGCGHIARAKIARVAVGGYTYRIAATPNLVCIDGRETDSDTEQLMVIATPAQVEALREAVSGAGWSRDERDSYTRGERVELLRAADEYTHLKPGDRGMVTAFHPPGPLGGRVLDVTWDSGSRLSLLLDEGDAARKL
ncbi:DUF4314 domain-containing protein [Streptomyces sp. NPDC001404]|uniref:DUF4314 domain-containing protein n=1 Tax=Streptomyces sp. NPDC001404 TaxID=3364571 RepID=UPI0036CE9824